MTASGPVLASLFVPMGSILRCFCDSCGAFFGYLGRGFLKLLVPPLQRPKATLAPSGAPWGT